MIFGVMSIRRVFSLLWCMFGICCNKKFKNKKDPHRWNIRIREIDSRKELKFKVQISAVFHGNKCTTNLPFKR